MPHADTDFNNNHSFIFTYRMKQNQFNSREGYLSGQLFKSLMGCNVINSLGLNINFECVSQIDGACYL